MTYLKSVNQLALELKLHPGCFSLDSEDNVVFLPTLWRPVSLDSGENNFQVCSWLLRRWKILLFGMSALRKTGRPRMHWESYIPLCLFPAVSPRKEYL